MMSRDYAKATDDFFEAGLAGSNRMGIFRGQSVAETLRLSALAWDQGVELVEIPLQSDESLEALRAAVAAGAERGKTVGAGTIMTAAQVRTIADLGVSFCVSPGTDLEVAEACEDAGIFHLPGIASATEISVALKHGYVWMKAFPASVLGSAWITAMQGPFPQVKLICTGGMSVDTMPEFLGAGARAVAIGGRWAS